MAEESQQERTEQATAKRRDDFRKRGQVAQSKEVHTAALFSATLLLWYFYAPLFWRELQELLAGLWRQAGAYSVNPETILPLALHLVRQLSLLLAPLLLAVMVIGILSSVLQIGFLLTAKPLEPDFSRLNPIKGAARFFSRRSLVEVLKSLAKVLLIALVAFWTVRSEFDRCLILVDMGLTDTICHLGRVAVLVLFRSCGILTALALLDFAFVRWEQEQKMKMTRQEQKEEVKETEGDPHLKGRIRSIQTSLARKRMMAEVPKADVVITNPTHLSVALSYVREKMDAPRVVAKGADHLALRIREVAEDHGVPLVENRPVAQALYRVEVGESVPEELFKAVAEILAYVYRLNGTVSGEGRR